MGMYLWMLWAEFAEQETNSLDLDYELLSLFMIIDFFFF